MPKKIARKILVPVVAAACALSVSACQAQTSTSDEASQETTNTAEETEQTTRRVGKAGVGYVTVPSDWISLATKSGSGDIEFCDITATKIITMKIMDSNDVDIVNAQNTADASTQASSTDAAASTNGTESNGTTSANSTTSQSTSGSATTSTEGTSSTGSTASKSSSSTSEEAKPVTVDEAVAAVIKHAKEYDVTDDNIVQEAATLANRDATKLTITYGDGTEVICWILTDDSGNVRYVAAEAPADSVAEVASIVENTYSF